MQTIFQTVGVVGTGAMGQGIAQIAVQAGSKVKLFDLQPEAVAKASKNIQQQWDKLLEKNRFTAEQVALFKANLQSASQLSDLSDCDLVIEAIVERLDVKKSFFAELEQLLRPTAVLVTNTSSLSVTAIASALKRPDQFAGYHFFNPVPGGLTDLE
jgi:3-hydroxybutyryl-CoA dehydrogenase